MAASLPGGPGSPTTVEPVQGDQDQPTDPATLAVADGELPVVSLHGEIDLSSVAAVRAVIDEALRHANATLVIDLSDVAFFDSSGLGLLVTAKDDATAQGAELVLRSPSAAARRILELGGTTDWFQIQS